MKELYNLDCENAVLGYLLFNPDGLINVLAEVALEEKHFELLEHKKIYRLILLLAEQKEEINPLSVMILAGKLGMELNSGYVIKLADTCINTKPFFLSCAKTIVDFWEQREIRRMLVETLENIDDVTMTFEEVKKNKLAELIHFLQVGEGKKSELKPLDEVAEEQFLDFVTSMGDDEFRKLHGVSSGLIDLDEKVGKFKQGNLVVIAGRPSMGKTQLGINLALNILKSKPGGIAFFSAEMSAKELSVRTLACLAGVDGFKLSNYQPLDPEEYTAVEEAIATLSEWKYSSRCYIQDESKPSQQKIIADLTQVQLQNQSISAVFVDYLQLIANVSEQSGSFGSEHQLLNQWIKFFKRISKEFNCPVFVISQLNRGVEQRQDKRPMLSDLRGSGGIEETADYILLLYDDSYYNPETRLDNISTLELNLAKNRHGATGTIDTLFVRDKQQIVSVLKSYMGG